MRRGWCRNGTAAWSRWCRCGNYWRRRGRWCNDSTPWRWWGSRSSRRRRSKKQWLFVLLWLLLPRVTHSLWQ